MVFQKLQHVLCIVALYAALKCSIFKPYCTLCGSLSLSQRFWTFFKGKLNISKGNSHFLKRRLPSCFTTIENCVAQKNGRWRWMLACSHVPWTYFVLMEFDEIIETAHTDRPLKIFEAKVRRKWRIWCSNWPRSWTHQAKDCEKTTMGMATYSDDSSITMGV